MTRVWPLGLAWLLLLLLVACAPVAPSAPQVSPAAKAPAPSAALVGAPPVPSAPARAAWQVEWDRVLSEARKEGKLTIATGLGAQSGSALVKDFTKAYGVSVEVVGSTSGQIDAKILAERRAGLYLWDAYVGGFVGPIVDLRPVGALDRLEPALILPDVTDPELIKKIWYRGELWWGDRDHTVLCTLMYPYPPLAINTNLVKPGEIKSYNDLLDPKWKDKMVLGDPTTNTSTFPTFILHTFGPDWLRQLVKNEPTIVGDRRLLGDWLAHGKVAIALGIKDNEFMPFKRVGAPVEIVMPAEGTWLSTDSSAIMNYNRPAHPNATRAFTNWLLSKEAQTTLSKLSGGQSDRLDVATDWLEPWAIRQPGVKYWEKETEEQALWINDQLKVCKDIFGPLMTK